MRCGCPQCGIWMVQSDSNPPACVCPECGYRCSACMGTNSVLSPEDLKKLGEDETGFLYEAIARDFDPDPEDIPIPPDEKEPSDPYPVDNFFRGNTGKPQNRKKT
ncbi:MAG: hypothetical protein II781_03320 [Clostridia bacterium]|nr:hypothetical protein [Clostridia bacterium]